MKLPIFFAVISVFTCFVKIVLPLDIVGLCAAECGTKACQDGCNLWNVSTSCHEICNGTFSVREQCLHCVVGCSIGTGLYLQNMKDNIGIPSAPHLVADSRTNDSITIQWTASIFKNISYLVQWRYDAPSATWEYYNAANTLKVNKLRICNLQPYTKYKFRIAWILLPQYGPLLSEESVVITTLPYGVPSTPPIITSVTAVGPTRISVSWDAPTFPNGPILSYVLYLKEHSSGFISVKDVEDMAGDLHYMFNNLRPSTVYSISVATRNNMGEGPSSSKNVTTPQKVHFTGLNLPEPYLLLATHYSILQQGLSIYDEPQLLYQPSNVSVIITGLSHHFKKALFFLSDSFGYVHRVLFPGGSKRVDEIIYSSSSFPTLLSVDWLNDRLYMVEEKQISRTALSGEFYEVVVSGFFKRPVDIQVDPFNGFLYWVLQGGIQGGIYRVDLEKISLSTVPFQAAQFIYKDSRLSSFAVDHKNFRIQVPKADINTVFSLSLSGSDSVNIRHNSQSPQFVNVKSLAMQNGLFYWTTGNSVYGEEFHPKEEKYYQNAYALRETPCTAVKIYHTDVQPHPVPLNPVEDVQAVFKEDMVKIAWARPRLLGGLGKGAWQRWLYEVHLSDERTGIIIYGVNISDTFYTVNNLCPNTSYSVQVRAYSNGGKGPWSSKFLGRTIYASTGPAKQFPYVLWSAREGLLKSDIIGEKVEPLIHTTNLNRAHITDLAWYNGLLFFNTNTSWVYTYKLSSHKSLTRLSNITNAVSIAVDWLAPKLYWSSPIHQLISRANIDGSQAEPLPIPTIAKELAIDSLEGRLYWATSHSVDCARLNGAERHTYFQTGLFSGKHVMGLTLDFDRHRLYWMVRSHEGAVLFTAQKACENCASLDESVQVIGSLLQDEVRGPLWYYSDRLFWLHERKEAFISDLTGGNTAVLKGLGLIGLYSMALVDPSLHPFPMTQDNKTANVVPLQIRKDEIFVDGSWDNFTIVWQPVTSVNYGKVFYELRVDDPKDFISLVTDDHNYVYPSQKLLPPFTSLTVFLRSYTYWAAAPQTVITVHTPMSIPSAPTHPRVFISYKKSPFQPLSQIEAEFRWLSPTNPNGLISGYHVKCWLITRGKSRNVCSDTWISGDELSFTLTGLLPNTSYFFQVQGKTAAGDGPYSSVAEGRTSKEFPVPKLLIAKNDAVKVADIDTHKEWLLSNKATYPVSVTFLGQEDRIYWLEEGGSLMSSKLDGSNTTLVKGLVGSGTSIALDWIGRYLYWTEVDRNDHYNTIWALDLSRQSVPRVLVNKSSAIGSIEVDPFSSILLWTSLNSNRPNHLMMSDVDGKNARPFFLQSINHHSISKRNTNAYSTNGKKSCNCPPRPDVGKAIAIDRSNPERVEVLWIDGKKGHIWSADMLGCICRLLVNATEKENSGLPPTSLTVDKSNIYWSNYVLGRVYSINKELQEIQPLEEKSYSDHPFMSAAQRRHEVYSEQIQGIRGIRAIGNHLQPYPDSSCLSPRPYNVTPHLISRSSTTLILRLPNAERPEMCSRMSFASVLYTVYYGSVDRNGQSRCTLTIKNCKSESTYNNTVILRNLDPFTNYTIRIAASNYYSSRRIAPGSAVIFQTKEGAPSAPIDVRAIPVTPTRINVYWRPPLIPNGNPIWYEVRWNTDTSQQHNGQSTVYTQQLQKPESVHYMALTHLSPRTRHFIVVRAYSSGGDLHSDSLEIESETFSLPFNLALLSASSHSLTIEWKSLPDSAISHHGLEYLEVGTNEWYFHSSNLTVADKTYTFFIDALKPKTDYMLRLLVNYRTSNVTFVWPQDQAFVFQTSGDIPDVPVAPEVREMGRNLYQVIWNEVLRNGAEDIVYELQVRSIADSSKPLPESVTSTENSTLGMLFSTETPVILEWTTVYNGSHSKWIVEDLSSKAHYQLRVRAITEYGASNFSDITSTMFLGEPGALTKLATEQTEVILIAVFTAMAFVILSVFLALFIVQKRKEKEKKILQASRPTLHAPDMELATLRELPHHGNFVHQNNTLYAVDDVPTDEELASIENIRREQIILTKFLGSGAFGEVFEGIAHDLRGEGVPPMKVAIKTLRKGATEQEKCEFLKEAKLMSNFKHDHILQLLGICLDNNPNFIILELMEGGDLLSFLRSNRPTSISPSFFSLDDLVGICVDVAKGCKYLEEMHFVHRDLAARNCLVSSYDPLMRVVKIGDFGLARDIYKNDYYRKEGEGLLPVRWMAPESLVDGIFTSQSDIWAFGVLLWEVMTLGQQPYPARTNLEVLYYVRAGGRLDKPVNCPEDLHLLMEKCWSYCPEERPIFTYCLEALEDLKHKTSAENTLPFTENDMPRYFQDGIDNLAYHEELDHQQQSSGNKFHGIVNTTIDHWPLLISRPADSLSTCSDPSAAVQDMVEHMHTASVKRAESINCPPHRQFSHMDSCATSPLLKAAFRRNAVTEPARYLTLLADSELATDIDGYEIPLPLPPALLQQRSRRPNPNYAELTRSLSCCSDSVQAVLPRCAVSSIVDASANLDGYILQGKMKVNRLGNAEKAATSPIVTSALLKSSVSSSEISASNGELTEATNPFYHDNSSGLAVTCTPSCHRCGNMNEKQVVDCLNSDSTWSLSAASTTTCHDSGASKRNSGISTLSAISGIELNYVPKSSWC